MLRRADTFQIADCGDPQCGAHLISFDEDGERICETVMNQDQMREIIKVFQAMLYERAVRLA